MGYNTICDWLGGAFTNEPNVSAGQLHTAKYLTQYHWTSVLFSRLNQASTLLLYAGDIFGKTNQRARTPLVISVSSFTQFQPAGFVISAIVRTQPITTLIGTAKCLPS